MAPKSGSKRSTALSTPSSATWIRSSSGSPLLAKRLAQCKASQRWSSMSCAARGRRWPGSAGTARILAGHRSSATCPRRPCDGHGGATTGRSSRGRSGTYARVPPRSCVGWLLCQLPAGGSATPKSTRVASAPVDLGITGRRAAVAAASAAGPGRPGAAARGRPRRHLRPRRRAGRRRGGRPGGRRPGRRHRVRPGGRRRDRRRRHRVRGGRRPRGVDILVTNAGGPRRARSPRPTSTPTRLALELNLLSTVAMRRAAVPAMAGRSWGRVVAITSITVRQPAAMLILSNTRVRAPPRS